jgi:hypothetical protein
VALTPCFQDRSASCQHRQKDVSSKEPVSSPNVLRGGNIAEFSFREDHDMISKIVCAAIIAVATIAAVPASAKSKMMGCSDASMAKADDMMMKMPDGENKTMAMQEMTSAKSSMSQRDMAGCSMHMNKAMKMGMMKSKTM